MFLFLCYLLYKNEKRHFYLAGLNEKTQLGDFLPPVQPKGTTFLISFCKQLVIKSHNC